MKKVLLITALATAFGVAYIERVPEHAEEKVAFYKWSLKGGCFPRYSCDQPRETEIG
jgi:hypothetical protein